MTGQQLKNAILQEAIEGRLVSQDPNDEPASVLLERIRAEKARLVKEKKIKKDKNESRIYRTDDGHWMEHFEDKNREDVCIDDEIPFDVPSGWEWCRLGNIQYLLTDGTHSRPQYTNTGIPFLSVKDISSGYVSFENVKYISLEDHLKLSKRCEPKRGDLLITKVGTTGIPVIVNTDRPFSLFVSLALVKFFNEYVDSRFLLIMMNSPLVQEQVKINTRGVGNKNWVLNAIYNTLILLPPLAEQQRIVEKIESLLPKVEAYGKAQEELEKLNEALPEQLKKSILQEAIEGRLVPQDPDDEPASVLLERIRAEKARLVKEKKIKKDKNESRIYRTEDGHWMEHFEDKKREDVCIDEEIPFELPSGWEWCRMGCLLTVKGGKRIPLGKTFSSEPTSHIYIRVTDMKNNTLIDTNLKYISDEVYNQIKNYTISKDDLYLTIAGTIGSIGVVPEKFDNMNLTENAVKLTNISINKNYIVYAVLSQMVQNQFVDKTKQMAQPKLAIERILTTVFPLPPLAEQHRIVERIESLLPKIEKLKIRK